MAGNDKRPPDDAAGPDRDEPQPWGAGAAPLRRRWAVWAAGGAVLAAAAIALGWPLISPLMPRAVTDLFADAEAPPDPAITALAVRTEALEGEVARLRNDLSAAAAQAGAAAPRSEAAQLAARIEALENRPAPPSHDERIAVLAERVEALAEGLDTLRRLPAAPGEGDAPAAGAVENARLQAALSRMEDRVAALEGLLRTVRDPALASLVESADARVDGIEADVKRLLEDRKTRKRDALLLAVGQLREALAGPRPFGAELDLVLGTAGDDPGIREAARPLEALAAEGVPTRAALVRRFPALAVRAAQAALVPEEGDWLDKTAARLSRVVTIRRVGEGAQEGGGALAALARAETLAAAGDLAGAAAALADVGGAPGRVLGEWREQARARADADDALARLSRRAVEISAAGASR